MSIFKRKLALEEETAVFILVNLADLLLTGAAFYFGAREVNVLADWVLTRWGLTGMVIYKFALVTFIIMTCQYIYALKPKTARFVLLFGSAAYGILITVVTFALFRQAFFTG